MSVVNLMRDAVRDGVIVIDKPSGMTSHDCVSIARKRLDTRQIGHTGTLDPMVTGVLPLCIGKATRYADYIMNAPKTYLCEMQLGVETTTQDIWGEVLRTSDASHVDEETVRRYMTELVGEIEQVPPAYSAVRVGGSRMFDLARSGEATAPLPARARTIYSLDIIELSLPRIVFSICCSKGTYVRTICHDMGARFGCGGVMTKLQRTASGGFSIDAALQLDALDRTIFDGSPSFYPLDEVVSRIREMGVIRIDNLHPRSRKLLDDGVRLDLAGCRGALIDEGYDVYSVYMDGALYGIARRVGDRIEMHKRFL